MNLEGIIFKSAGKNKFQLFNREISWLKFNERVLQEAENPEVPLLERIKFLSIFSSNQDEFFRIRVASIIKVLENTNADQRKEFNFDPAQVLDKIQKISINLQHRFENVFDNDIRIALSKNEIYLLNEKTIPSALVPEITTQFKLNILPYLNPIMISSRHPFPNLQDRRLYLFIKMRSILAQDATKYALLEIPTRAVARFFNFKDEEGKDYVLFVDDIIRLNLSMLFESQYFTDFEAYTIKITRDADLDFDFDIKDNLIEKINRGLKARKTGTLVRFVYDASLPTEMLDLIGKRLKLLARNLIPGGRYHNLSDLVNFPSLGNNKLSYPSLSLASNSLLDQHLSTFKAVSIADVMLHQPYQSFDYILRLLREASIDPTVTAIKVTLYRVAKISVVANSLITAVLNGKQVTAIVEVKARFDEENNIYWGQRLEEAGAKVVYSFPGLKVHAKMCLISRTEDQKQVYYAHLSTGNYNGQTAKLYCDDSIITKDKRLTTEVARLFKTLETGQEPYRFNHLLVAPYFMKSKFIELINNEITLAKKGYKAWLIFKMNSLVDDEMIAKLYEANNAGVKIQLIIRGICCLIPGIEGLSNNIEVVSIIDRFLEHSRVYIFGNNGNEKIYLSSADLMGRNLNKRIETAFPIYDPKLKTEIMTIINFQLADNVKARVIDSLQTNNYKADIEQKVRSQEATYTYFKQLAKNGTRGN